MLFQPSRESVRKAEYTEIDEDRQGFDKELDSILTFLRLNCELIPEYSESAPETAEEGFDKELTDTKTEESLLDIWRLICTLIPEYSESAPEKAEEGFDKGLTDTKAEDSILTCLRLNCELIPENSQSAPEKAEEGFDKKLTVTETEENIFTFLRLNCELIPEYSESAPETAEGGDSSQNTQKHSALLSTVDNDRSDVPNCGHDAESSDDDECWRCSSHSPSSSDSSYHDDFNINGQIIPCNTGAGLTGSMEQPLLSPGWEIQAEFTEEGGRLCKPGSDVVLTVPPGAVRKGQTVTIHTAVCVDIDLMYRELKLLNENEQIVSPFVEYLAVDNYTFDIHVSISLPHFLPSDVDLDSVNVYHLSHGDDDQRLILSQVTRCDISMGPASVHYYIYNSDTRELQVYTKQFCGVLCTYCRKDTKHPKIPPRLLLRGRGTIKWQLDRQHVHVNVYLWDERITLRDFMRDAEFDKLSNPEYIDLTGELSDSSLHVELIKGNDLNELQHHISDLGSSIFPAKKEVQVCKWFGCKRCFKKKRFHRKDFQWHLTFPQNHVNIECLVLFVNSIYNTKDSSVRESSTLHVEIIRENEPENQMTASNGSLISQPENLSLANFSSNNSEY